MNKIYDLYILNCCNTFLPLQVYFLPIYKNRIILVLGKLPYSKEVIKKNWHILFQDSTLIWLT
jgi:hypothetical protein